MPYIGKSPLHGNYSKLDDFSGDFDGSDATHALAINSIALTPVTEAAVIISINGVIQEPVSDYTVSGTNITFTTAPASGANFFGVVLGEQLAGNTPSDSTITSAKLSGNLVTPGTLDVNGQELILDADADTSIHASTDDQIDIKISGADDFKFTANTFTVLSGSTLTVASGATIANSGTATGFGGSDPDSADGDTLGTASAEWSDLYLADGSVIYFGNDQEIKVTHVADTGLTLKHTATADDKPINLTLQTGETDMAADDVIGKISFQAPDEGTGTDAILVAAAIQARAEGDFSSSSNATSIDFMTGLSAAAAKRWSITSAGSFLNAGTNTIDMNAGELILDADADTSITASTDDQIDIKISGADDFTFTANTFNILSGSTLAVNSGSTIANSGTATGFPGWQLIQSQTASDSATLDFESGIDSTYDCYQFVCTAIIPGTEGNGFHLLTSTDGGSNYDTGASDYSWAHQRISGGSFDGGIDVADDSIILTVAGTGSASGQHIAGIVFLYNPASVLTTLFDWHLGHINNSEAYYPETGGGAVWAVENVDGVRFMYGSGNIASGTIALYGLKK